MIDFTIYIDIIYQQISFYLYSVQFLLGMKRISQKQKQRERQFSTQDLKLYKKEEILDIQRYSLSRAIYQINQITNNFKKSIILPIDTIQTIQRSKLQQRCVKHTTALSLYCQIDREPLCVSCLYGQSSRHKKHRVIPLQRAYSLIQQDAVSYSNKIHQIMKQLDSLIYLSKQNIKVIEKTKPEILYKVQQFYHQCKQSIAEKQKIQMREIAQYYDRVKYENIKFASDFNIMLSFINDRSQNVLKKVTQESIISKRNVLQLLAKSDRFLPKSILKQDYSEKIVDIFKYAQIFDIIEKKLNLSFPQEKQQRYHSPKGFRSKTPQLFSAKNIKLDTSSPKKERQSSRLETNGAKEKSQERLKKFQMLKNKR